MAISHRIRSRTPSADYWPGFVDAMATLLLVLVFLLSIFMLTQFFLAQSITGKDSALDRLRSQVSELADLLALASSKTPIYSQRLPPSPVPSPPQKMSNPGLPAFLPKAQVQANVKPYCYRS